MAAPFQTEMVIVDGTDEYEVQVVVADATTSVGQLLAATLGRRVDNVLCDGFPVDAALPVADAPLHRGSRLEALQDRPTPPTCSLVGFAGDRAGERLLLGPGVHHLGSIDVGVQVRSFQGGCDIGETASLYVDVDGAAQLDPSGLSAVVNGTEIAVMTRLEPGDVIELGVNRYRYRPLGDHNASTHNSSDQNAERLGVAFNRPPRSEFPASLPQLAAPASPPEAQRPMRFGWGALLIPILIGGVMAFVWSPMMAIFAIFSPAMLLANYYEDKRRARQTNAESAQSVAEAMVEFRRRLAALFRAAQILTWRSSPGPDEMLERLADGDSRMWQRRHHHPDYLELGIGVGSVGWSPEVTPAEPDRADAANEVLRRVTTLPDVPVTIDLGGGGVVGVAGHRRRQIEMVRWLVIQAAAHHGPSDLAIGIISDHLEEWDCLKWLPHLQVNGESDRLIVAAPGESADELLAPMLEAAEDSMAAAVRERPAGPAVLLVVDIDDMTGAGAASIRRALHGDGATRRCAIALGRTVEELPSSCTDIVTVDGTGGASLERPSAALRQRDIRTWRLSAAATRRMGRAIGRHRDPELRLTGAGLADVVHLLDLLGLSERSSDAVVRRWTAAGPIPRCAAPIGATADGPLVVDWVNDGPHGLLAGTTGSGKSELLRSLVASLAATVDPEHLNFVLIDYKGGSAFDSCARLPHTVGMVTDLDGHLAQRALTCLEAELRYREETLREVGAGDIDEYHGLISADPLPRLLVVIDEFAALAKELPDFMAALVDVAQRGRSLGVHLLLATQRPNGVINDNIRANTNLRLSLRVQDIQDSTDVIGTPDAASLPRSRPGRGFVRRGPGDVVAFQSALVTGLSGATAANLSVRPFTLVPNELDPSGTISNETTDADTDLDVLVEMIREAAHKAEMGPSRLPWPEALPQTLSIGELQLPNGQSLSRSEVIIGLADEPHRQRRRPFTWSYESNLLIYGVHGCGTSTALASVITSACGATSPADLHAYILDFDDQRLKGLEDLPHVGAVIGSGERDRQIRLLRYLQLEVAERRDLAASDPQALAERPRVIVGLDNFGGFRAAFDEPGDMATKDGLTRLIADGPGVGIVVIATAKQAIDIPTNVASLVTAKLVMQLADRYEYSGLGVTITEPTEVAGRAFAAGSSLEVQMVQYSQQERQDISAAAAQPLDGRRPWPIELLPLEVKIPDIVEAAEVFDLEWRIPVAIGDDRLSPVGWSLREGDHVLVSGPARSGKSTTLATIAAVLRGARPDIRITAFTPRRSVLTDCAEVDLFVIDPEQLRAAVAAAPTDLPHAILIDDADDIPDDDGLIASLVADRHPQRHIFAAGAADMLRSSYGHWTQGVRRSRLGLALNPNVTNDGDLWQASLPRYGPTSFPAGRGYLIAEGQVELAQTAWQ